MIQPLAEAPMLVEVGRMELGSELVLPAVGSLAVAHAMPEAKGGGVDCVTGKKCYLENCEWLGCAIERGRRS